MARKIITPKKLSYTEFITKKGFALISAVSERGKVSMQVGMVVTMDIRKVPHKYFDPTRNDHGENLFICGFSLIEGGNVIQVHCCPKDQYKSNIETSFETGIPAGDVYNLGQIKYVRHLLGARNPFQ